MLLVQVKILFGIVLKYSPFFFFHVISGYFRIGRNNKLTLASSTGMEVWTIEGIIEGDYTHPLWLPQIAAAKLVIQCPRVVMTESSRTEVRVESLIFSNTV